MGFSRQEYWSGLPCPPPGDLPNPGMEPVSLMSPALASGFFTTRADIAKCPLEGKVSPYLGSMDQNWILKNPLKNTLLSCIYDFTHLRDFYLPAPPCPNSTTSLQGQAPMPPPSCVFNVERASPISSLYSTLKLFSIGGKLLYNVVLVFLYGNVNQLLIYIYPSWASLSPPPSYPTTLGHHRQLSRALCFI